MNSKKKKILNKKSKRYEKILPIIFLANLIIINPFNFIENGDKVLEIHYSPTILIDGDSDLNNQSIVNGWVGIGTNNNPYIIGNYSYDSIDNPISIYNTTKSILISNININNSKKPCIVLGNTKNIIIEKVNLMNNSMDNLIVDNCDSIIINKIIILNCTEGVEIIGSNNVILKNSLITNNLITQSYRRIINVYSSDNVSIEKNSIFSTLDKITYLSIIINYGKNNSFIDNYINNIRSIGISSGKIINNIIINTSILTGNGPNIYIENNIIDYYINPNYYIINIGGKANIIVKENIISSSRFDREGIYINNRDNDIGKLYFYSNKMINTGFRITDLSKKDTIIITDNNTINGKNILYQSNIKSMKIDCNYIGQIILFNCTDINLNNLNIDRIKWGMEFHSCNSIIIKNGSIKYTEKGLYIIKSNNISLFNITFENVGNGIDGSIDQGIIDNCLFIKATSTSIFLSNFNNSIISNCSFFNCNEGIFLPLYQFQTDYVKQSIFNCYFYECNESLSYENYMLELDKKEQVDIKIHDNIFERSNKPAIILSDRSRYFSIYENVFLFNDGSNETYNPSKKQVDDGGLNNEWNLTDGPGNYWSDWQLEDLDEDGDVDLPRPIKGQTYDHHPISRTNSSIVRPPVNVIALGADGKIVLTWEKPARNPFMDPFHYTLYRSEAGSPFMVLNKMTEGVLSYIDTNVKEAVNYSYYLVSNNSFGYGKPSSMVTSMVDIEPPTLRIIEPEDGSIFKVSDVTVEWEVSDPIGIGKVELKLDNEREWLNVTGQSNHTFHHLIDSKYNLEVKAIDRIGNTRERNVSFMVDTTPPEIELKWSNEDRIAFRGKLNVSWKCIDLVSGISDVSYELDQEESVLVGSEWTLSLQDLEHGHHSFKLKAIDLAGNEMIIEEDFMMDLIEPVLEILEPISGTITNDDNVNISWTCQDIDTRILYIQGKLDGLEVFNLSWTDVEYRTRLEDGYHLIEVSTSDAAGNVVSRSVNITIDTNSPYVVSFGPVGMEVNITEPVWVVISEDLTPGSYSMTAIGIEGRTYWEGNKLVLEPDQDLIPGKNYSVKVIGMDLAGNELDHSWSFRTREEVIPNGNGHPDREKFPLLLVLMISVLVSVLMIILGLVTFQIIKKNKELGIYGKINEINTDKDKKEE